MEPTIVWKVSQLEREVKDGYVFNVHYTVEASDDSYSQGAYGSIGLDRPDKLIKYDKLTEDKVIEWVKEKLGEEKVSEVNKMLLDQLAEKHAPTKATGLPW